MTARSIARFTGRVVVIATILTFAGLIALQYARVIHRNVVLAHTLSAVEQDIAKLKAGREERLNTIRRLENPRGAIPEIHDKLHLTMPNESIIYLKGHAP
jgi:cell division protein FtsB